MAKAKPKIQYNFLILLLMLLLLLLILIVFYILRAIKPGQIRIYHDSFDEYKLGIANQSKIPKIIWAFWAGEPNDFVQKCIDSWKYYNPDYIIHIVNKSNYSKYTDVNISAIKHSSDSLARYSDYIRLYILAKHGGIWIDASTICHAPFSWIHGIQTNTDCDMVGYYLDGFTTPNYLAFSPVIESWFFACVPESKFVGDWRDEFLRTSNFDNINGYVEDVKHSGIDLQNIDAPDYLAIHVAAQKILQTNKNVYNIVLFSASTTAFKYLSDVDWDSQKAVEILENKSTAKQYYQYPILKLRGRERKVIDYFGGDVTPMFSHLQST